MARLTRCLPLAVAVAVAAAVVPAQRRAIQLTTASEPHLNAKISPNGNWVAYLGPGKIGLVAYAISAETTIATGTAISSFVWSPRSTGVYYLDSGVLRFASTSGGTPLTLATIPGQATGVWCVDAADRTLWGTRYDAGASLYRIYTIRTTGASRVDIAADAFVIDDVRLDPSETKLLFRSSDPTPFGPREFFRADASGANVVSLSPGGLNTLPDNADWVDNGQSIAFTMNSVTSNLPHLVRIGPSGTAITMLSEGANFRRFSTVSADRQWVVHQARWARGTGPAVIPPGGGGLVVLTAEDNTTFTMTAPPSVDSTGTRVAFAATVGGGLSQVYRIDIDRELRIFPRCEIGKPLTIELPIASNEVGAAFVGIGLLPAPFKLTGFTYGLILDPNVLVTVFAGSSSSGKLSLTVPIPADPSMITQSLFLQGIRVKNPQNGDFTRFAEVLVF